jgi:lipid II:glycine glycyltransferase (peptidoglycan interpeptide bridge formation enzyme)
MNKNSISGQDISLSLLKNLNPDQQCDIQISRALNDPEWDSFLASTSGGHHVQSSMWAQVKAKINWKVSRIVVKEQGQIIGGAQLLIRKLAPLTSVVYLSKGPVLGFSSLPLFERIVRQVIEIAQKNNALLLAVQPPGNRQDVASQLLQMGFESSQLELAPVASIRLDLCPSLDQIVANMKRQTRQNIRRGVRSGLVVRDGIESDLDTFYEFHRATSRRQGFEPYAKEYYAEMWRIFEPHGYIHLFVAEYESKPITGLLVIPFGDTVIAKILGWSGDHPDLRPNDAVFWNAIQWSKLNDYRYFDFEGIDQSGARAILAGEALPAELQHSPDFLKLGYGGQVVLYPPAFEMIRNPLARWVYKKISPTVGGESWGSRIFDILRKR